ncbi:MAG: hypothetical protein ORO03_00410 [Alphaproteobacteria bacterium]|nr:hypothetical protein [Alphaproteobacteria bacterium]
MNSRSSLFNEDQPEEPNPMAPETVETVAQLKRRRSPSKRVPKPSVEMVPEVAPEPTTVGVSDSPLPAETLAATAPPPPRSPRSPKPRSPRKPRVSAAATSEPYPRESPQPSILVAPTVMTETGQATEAAPEVPATTDTPVSPHPPEPHRGRNRKYEGSREASRRGRSDGRQQNHPEARDASRDSQGESRRERNPPGRKQFQERSRDGGRFDRFDHDPTSFEQSGFIPEFLLKATKRVAPPDAE